MSQIEVEIVCVGDELLDGTIADRNTRFLGNFLSERGAVLKRAFVVPDEIDAICEALESCSAELVVVSGGLGPTSDDVTREAAAKWAGDTLELNESILTKLRELFEARGYTFTANNRRQAFFPGSAQILDTEVGTAAGFLLEAHGRKTFFFPGVPSEFRWYCEHEIERWTGDSTVHKRRLFFHGRGESGLATSLDGIEDLAHKHGVRVGYRAEYPVIELKLVGQPEGVRVLQEFALERISPWWIGADDEGLSARIGRLLNQSQTTVSTVESCTAGAIAAAITDVPGSSAYFGHGWVTYSNEAKISEVGVDRDVLESYGAVSAQTVCQMALGGARRAKSDWGIAVSGIAGPGGGSVEKPVGQVHLAVASKDHVWHRQIQLRGSRARIREGTVFGALSLLLWILEDRIAEHRFDGPFPCESVEYEIDTLEFS